jgi:hypothetical protein
MQSTPCKVQCAKNTSFCGACKQHHADTSTNSTATLCYNKSCHTEVRERVTLCSIKNTTHHYASNIHAMQLKCVDHTNIVPILHNSLCSQTGRAQYVSCAVTRSNTTHKLMPQHTQQRTSFQQRDAAMGQTLTPE